MFSVCCHPVGSIRHNNHGDPECLQLDCIWLVSGILVRDPDRSHLFCHHLDEKTKTCCPLSFTQVAFSRSSVLVRPALNRCTDGRNGIRIASKHLGFNDLSYEPRRSLASRPQRLFLSDAHPYTALLESLGGIRHNAPPDPQWGRSFRQFCAVVQYDRVPNRSIPPSKAIRRRLANSAVRRGFRWHDSHGNPPIVQHAK